MGVYAVEYLPSPTENEIPLGVVNYDEEWVLEYLNAQLKGDEGDVIQLTEIDGGSRTFTLNYMSGKWKSVQVLNISDLKGSDVVDQGPYNQEA